MSFSINISSVSPNATGPDSNIYDIDNCPNCLNIKQQLEEHFNPKNEEPKKIEIEDIKPGKGESICFKLKIKPGHDNEVLKFFSDKVCH